MPNNTPGGDYVNWNNIMSVSAKLNSDVVEQINQIQELCMMESFDQKSSQFHLQKSLELRMSELASWRWVFEDLSKRLDDAVGLLDYERNAIVVVKRRLNEEVSMQSKLASKPGALKPFDDEVEHAILKEYKLLCHQKTCFDKLLLDLDNTILFTKKTKRRINEDLIRKTSAISIDEGSFEFKNSNARIKRKKLKTKQKWEECCESLKEAGLKALNNAFITREQIRYARVNLSVIAQAAASRVDNGLRRRLHANKVKLEDLMWHKEEAKQESISLSEELAANEDTILTIIDQMRFIEGRISERKLRPPGEVVKDEGDRRLHDELARLKRSAKELNIVIQNTRSLQNELNEALTHIGCCAEDLRHIIELDKNRIRSRQDDVECETSKATTPARTETRDPAQLEVILEEDESTEFYDQARMRY